MHQMFRNTGNWTFIFTDYWNKWKVQRDFILRPDQIQREVAENIAPEEAHLVFE